MRTLKSKGGFTLVELIVVIAILAILAGVAIPVYNGYINKAQDAAAVTELDAIASAAQAANAIAGTSIDYIVVTGTNVTVKGAGDLAKDFDEDFMMYVQGAADADADELGVFTKTTDLGTGTYKNGAVWVREAKDAVPYADGKTLDCEAGWNAIPNA